MPTTGVADNYCKRTLAPRMPAPALTDRMHVCQVTDVDDNLAINDVMVEPYLLKVLSNYQGADPVPPLSRLPLVLCQDLVHCPATTLPAVASNFATSPLQLSHLDVPGHRSAMGQQHCLLEVHKLARSRGHGVWHDWVSGPSPHQHKHTSRYQHPSNHKGPGACKCSFLWHPF